IGVHLQTWGAFARRPAILSVARTVEDAGLDSVWVADRVVFPLRSRTQYPYGELLYAAEDGFLEALSTLAVVAGATSRISLGTSALVLPTRHPLLLAKSIATLDVLSEGRIVLAVGIGWWREEYEALGVPFERRGHRFEEQIRILRRLWTDGRAAHNGE